MKQLEWKTQNKSTWGDGPWQDEPDKAQFTDEETGYPCLVVRNNSGSLCGYVGVPETHPLHGVGYNNCSAQPPCNTESYSYCEHEPESMLAVHGGITFADKCADTIEPDKHICHVVEPGEDDNVWWLGFDCAHSGDLSPGYKNYSSPRDTYKDIRYVKAQIAHLAQQLKAIEQHRRMK